MVEIYYNPRCSKCRISKQLLVDAGEIVHEVRYLDSPPTEQELRGVIAQLGCAVRDIIRTKEKLYAELELDNSALSDEELITILVEYPILIERPIVIKDGKAVIGRPPENVLELL